MIKKIKIGFSDIGGIYIGKDIQTEQHLHHAITIVISFSENFNFWFEQQKISCPGVIIQPHTLRKFNSQKKNYVAFIHIDPFSIQGLKLTNKIETFRQLTPLQLKNTTKVLKKWFFDKKNNEELTMEVINNIICEIKTINNNKIDARVKNSIDLIRQTETVTLKKVADYVNLSTFRFSHLFRQETGMSFREFVLYNKLIKSLKAIYQQQNLTYSSYSGGFADQSHFTRTFYKAFGILPSKSVK